MAVASVLNELRLTAEVVNHPAWGLGVELTARRRKEALLQ